MYTTIKAYVKWVKIYEPDNYAGVENWKIDVYPFDEKEMGKYDALNLMLEKKMDISDDPFLSGREFIRMRRGVKKLIKDELVIFSPPEVTGLITVRYVNDDGEKVRQYNKSDKVNVRRVDGDGNEIVGAIDREHNTQYLIPNASICLVNLSHYDTFKGKGHRLENIRVLELTEYQPEKEDYKDTVRSEAAGVKPKAEPKKVEKKEEKPSVAEDLNDKIPW